MRITLEQLLTPTVDLAAAIQNGESFDIEGNITYVIKAGGDRKVEIDEWCSMSCSDDWTSIGPASWSVSEEHICGWSFRDDEDAMLFKLTWL